MNTQKTFPYKKVKSTHIGIMEEETDEGVFMIGVWMITITDGHKFGLAYDSNDWRKEHGEDISPLICCEWDHFEFLETDYGAYIVAYSNEKCCCFSTSGETLPLDDGTCRISVEMQRITEIIYDNIKSGTRRLLLLSQGENKYYYDLKNGALSDAFDRVYPLGDAFVECEKNYRSEVVYLDDDIVFPHPMINECLFFSCYYKNGYVFAVCANNRWEISYLLFYSKNKKSFYKSDIYDKIDVLGILDFSHAYNFMYGMRALKEGEEITILSCNGQWTDEDILNNGFKRI